MTWHICLFAVLFNIALFSPGTGTTGTGSGSTAQTEATDSLSRHQARLQAAAAAASIYEKSYVYPSMNSFVWYDISPKMLSFTIFSFLTPKGTSCSCN